MYERSKNRYLLCVKTMYSLFVMIQIFYNSHYATKTGGKLIYNLSYLCLFIFLGIVVLNLPAIVTNKRRLGSFVLLGGVFILTYLHGGYDSILYMYLVPFLPLVIRGEDLLLLDYKVRILSVGILMILSPLLGSYTIYNGATHELIRTSLGFANPNGAALMLLVLCMEAIILRGRLSSQIVILTNLISLLLMVVLLKSRTSLLMYILFIFLYCFFQKKKQPSKEIRILLSLIPELLLAVSYIAVVLYQTRPSEMLIRLDMLLSGRLHLAGKFLNKYSAHTLWGQKLIFDHGGKHIGALDNAYINMLLRKGMIPTLAILILFSIVIYKLSNQKNMKYLPAFITFLVIGLSETMLFYFSYNSFLMTMMIAIIDKRVVDTSTGRDIDESEYNRSSIQ